MDEIAERADGKFAELVKAMAGLCAPGGCGWDPEATIETIKSYLLDESYEVMDSIDFRGMAKARGGIGRLTPAAGVLGRDGE